MTGIQRPTKRASWQRSFPVCPTWQRVTFTFCAAKDERDVLSLGSDPGFLGRDREGKDQTEHQGLPRLAGRRDQSQFPSRAGPRWFVTIKDRQDGKNAFFTKGEREEETRQSAGPYALYQSDVERIMQQCRYYVNSYQGGYVYGLLRKQYSLQTCPITLLQNCFELLLLRNRNLSSHFGLHEKAFRVLI